MRTRLTTREASPPTIHGDAATIALPRELDAVAAETERSRELLDRPDDWDDAGSPGYTLATWSHTTGLLADISRQLCEESGSPPTITDVYPGTRGNIDVEIHGPSRRLLSSVSVDETMPTRYFGKDEATSLTISGQIAAVEVPDHLVTWLAE